MHRRAPEDAVTARSETKVTQISPPSALVFVRLLSEGREPISMETGSMTRHRQGRDIALAAAVVHPRSRESWRRGAA